MESNTNITLYRKRFIPEEIICLKDDIILENSNDLIITKWHTLKPRKDIATGISAYFINEGFKISKIFDNNNKFVYWYCDIIKTQKDVLHNSYIFIDLLIDIIIFEDGFVKVVDTNEVADAFSSNLIDGEIVCEALIKLDNLLNIIYSKKFTNYTKYIENYLM